MSTDFSTSRCVREMFLAEALGIDRGLRLQGRQPDIDARQHLGDDIMQLAADPLALFLLRRQNPAGQMPQLLLQAPRLLQQPAGVLLALPEGLLHGLAPGDFLLQLPVGGGEIQGAPVQRLVQPAQVGVGLQRRAVRFLHRRGWPRQRTSPPA